MKKPLLLLLLVITSSCLPGKLVPYDFTPEQNNIRTYIELGDIKVSLENIEIQNDYYVFEVGIQNNSTSPLSLETARLLKFADPIAYPDGESQKRSQEVVKIMPPDEILEVFETKEENAKAAGFLLFLLGAAISSFDIIQDAKDNSKSDWTRQDARKSVNRDVFTGVSLLANDVLSEVSVNKAEKAAIELTYLPDELFNKEVIAPGEEYYGKIFFEKREERYPYHRIVWPMKDYDLLFDFRMSTRKENRFLKTQGN